MSPESSEKERRSYPRHKRHLAVAIDGGGRTGRAGISHDVSVRGLLLNTRSRFKPGDEVVLGLHLDPNPRADVTSVRGRIVRVDSVELRSPFPWRYLAAVELEQPFPELDSTEPAKAAQRS